MTVDTQTIRASELPVAVRMTDPAIEDARALRDIAQARP
jgi:hypothetical protein